MDNLPDEPQRHRGFSSPQGHRPPGTRPSTEEPLDPGQPYADDMNSAEDDGSLEGRPFLTHQVYEDDDDESVFEKDDWNTHAGAHHWSWKLVLFLLLLLLLTVSGLAAIVIGVAPAGKGNGAGHNDHGGTTSPDHGHDHQDEHHDSPTDGSDSPNIQYKEDAPRDARLRDTSDYILDPSWDFDAAPATREYFWTINNAQLNPDGVFRPMLLINNQFPGPLIECNEGDTIIAHVDNQGVNATAMHFHGMYQNGTNSMDGTVGVTQCAIAPNTTFTYHFTVKGQSGTYWYHAHHSAQASDGVLGPMVVHSSNEKTALQEVDYATDRVVMIQDFYHNTTAELLMDYLQPRRENEEPVPDNGLINGRGWRDCDDFPGWPCDNSNSSRHTFHLEANQRHRLRFVNVGAFSQFQVQIDEHPFYVTEVDGTDVHPEPFHRLNILPGQRYSLVLETNVTTSNAYWMRARMVTHCFKRKNRYLEAEMRAVIRYSAPDSRMLRSEPEPVPTSKDWSDVIEITCRDLNTSLLHPVEHMALPPADDYITLRANFEIGAWRLSRGFFNDSTWHPNATYPALHRLLDSPAKAISLDKPFGINDLAFDPENDLVLQTKGIRTVDLLINSFDDGAHPFHLHGHKFFVLLNGRSGYPPKPEELQGILEEKGIVENPLRRDVVTVEGYAWVVIRVVLDNPGLWAFHCHNAWHAESGMLMQFLVRGEEVVKWEIDSHEREMCGLKGVHTGMRPDDSLWFGSFDR